MAQTENGVGISFKLADGTMVWARRDEWVELLKDVKAIRGEVFTEALENSLKSNEQVEALIPVEKAIEMLEQAPVAPPTTGGGTCKGCGQPKDKLIPAGVSNKTGKPYKAFFVCQTQGCPGR